MKNPTPQDEARKPGRSFDDPSKALGADLIERSGVSPDLKEDFRAREDQAEAAGHGVAERAKVISVLRKAEELIAENNLPAGENTFRRALELAAGRIGLTIEEYDALIKDDAEVLELQRKVEDACVACRKS